MFLVTSPGKKSLLSGGSPGKNSPRLKTRSSAERESQMKRILVVLAFLSFAPFAFAQRIDETNGKHTQLYPTKDKAPGWAKPGGAGGQNLTYHGGPTITNAKSFAIFWGSQW